jgi:hypothetical protein
MTNEQRELRAPSTSDFHLDVEGVGTFVFARRTMRDELRISAEYSRLTEGVLTPTPYLDTVAGWMATLKVLTVKCPHNWDPETMDPFDTDTEEKILKVYGALRVKEGSFRKKPQVDSQAERPGTVPDA